MLAWVWIDASAAKAGPAGYSVAGVGPRFNCAGGVPLVRSSGLNLGLTYIQFPGITNTLGASGELIATATLAECGSGCTDRGMITADTISDSGGRVLRILTQNDAGTSIDTDFVVVVYGKGVASSPTSAEADNTAADRA